MPRRASLQKNMAEGVLDVICERDTLRGIDFPEMAAVSGRISLNTNEIHEESHSIRILTVWI